MFTEGIRVHPTKIEAIMNWKPPRNVRWKSGSICLKTVETA